MSSVDERGREENIGLRLPSPSAEFARKTFTEWTQKCARSRFTSEPVQTAIVLRNLEFAVMFVK